MTRQKLAGNALYATVETNDLGSMQNELPLGNPIANPNGSMAVPGPDAFLSMVASAGIYDPNVVNMASLMDSDLPDRSIYSLLAHLVALHHVDTQPLEARAAAAIMQAARACTP